MKFKVGDILGIYDARYKAIKVYCENGTDYCDVTSNGGKYTHRHHQQSMFRLIKIPKIDWRKEL